MKIGDLLEKLQDLPPDTPLCVAEIDEAFAINVAGVEVIDSARVQDQRPSGRESVELGNGSDKVVVLRW